MAHPNSKTARVMDKFHGERFSLWKLKMEMVMASIDVWNIINKSENAPPSDADPKVLKEYERPIKKVMSIIGLNLADNQFVHIKSCKKLVKT